MPWSWVLNVFWDLLICCVPGSGQDLLSQGANVTVWHLTKRCWGGVLVRLDSLFHRISWLGLLGEGISEPRPDWVHKPVELGPMGG